MPIPSSRSTAHGFAGSNLGASALGDVNSLAVAAGKRLADGDPGAAFALADRRCRLIVPAARDFILRAQTHRANGRLDEARQDLREAAKLDPIDAMIDRAALVFGDDEMRREAANRVLFAAASTSRLRRTALHVLFEFGSLCTYRLHRTDTLVSGWIAWRGPAEAQIRLETSNGPLAFALSPDRDHPLAEGDVSAAQVSIEIEAGSPFQASLVLPDGKFELVAEPDRQPTEKRQIIPTPCRVARTSEDAPFVTVVVPVYADFEATRACFEALAAALPRFPCRIVAVDDASPVPELRSYLDAGSARGAFELLRNGSNAGFAASVNAALATRERGDVLLLNADATLAPGAIDRLRALSRSTTDVGAITPFSNNGELTSWPVPHEANPLPPPAEVAALDALARTANGDALIDLPNGVGFCLYVTEACLDAVGPLPEIYAQGYFEDVEFCLRARERGFRIVAAAGVYVGHAGSRSFGRRKAALVARNLALLEARFPGYRLETAAFVALDPLAPFRAALDGLAPPKGPVVIFACGSGAAQDVARRRATRPLPNGAAALIMESARGGRTVRVRREGGGTPQSLTFDFNAAENRGAFEAYLGKLDVIRVELADPASLPEAALSALLRLEAGIALVCGHLGWFATASAPPDEACRDRSTADPCEFCRQHAASRHDSVARDQSRRLKLGRALQRAERVTPLDRIAQTFAERVFRGRAGALEPLAAKSLPASRGPRSPVAALGALSPHPSVAIDSLLLRLARRLQASPEPRRLVVFGACVDDARLMAAGTAFVTGPANPSEYLELARHYAVDALLSPDRGGGFGELDALAAALGAAKAYFDWSFGGFRADEGDLSLDPRLCAEKAASLLEAWMRGESEPSP